MNRSAAREETFKLLYSLEIQKDNLALKIVLIVPLRFLKDSSITIFSILSLFAKVLSPFLSGFIIDYDNYRTFSIWNQI